MGKVKKTVTVYVVRRVDWEYDDEYFHRIEGHDDPSSLSLRSFLSPEKAETYRHERERERRGYQNPFDYGGDGPDLADYSTLSSEAFSDRMEAVGLGEVVSRRWSVVSYLEWYDSLHKPTPEQRHAVWDALDLVRFFEVVPMHVELEG